MTNELKRHLETAGVYKGLEAIGMSILQANSLLLMHHNPEESELEEHAALLSSLTRDLESELKPLRDLAVDSDD